VKKVGTLCAWKGYANNPEKNSFRAWSYKRMITAETLTGFYEKANMLR